MSRPDNRLNVSWLCDAAGVSRSGYYHYLSTGDLRQQREDRDAADFTMILTAYNYRGYAKGARSIYMYFLHEEPPLYMNLKKIRRLMKKYGLICPIRKANPYRRMRKALRSEQVVDNLLNREFESHGPRRVLLTDITYLLNGKAPRCYMCTIIDAYTKELLAWELSTSLEVDFVLQAIQELIEDHGISLSAETLIHSDQGTHFTSVKFKQLISDESLRQSMSRRANCWDNAPQESFYGHMKDEIDLSPCQTFDDIYEVIEDWTHYYNYERYQWKLAKLSPCEYYKFIMTGIYPLKILPSKNQGLLAAVLVRPEFLKTDSENNLSCP